MVRKRTLPSHLTAPTARNVRVSGGWYLPKVSAARLQKAAQHLCAASYFPALPEL
ncbi:hypothetical protein [Nostoc sp.]|uniref:hypothetical protein n=1 Tax=Nostoc sp. TaxID=1180 RepID=UPI002FFD2F08